MSWRNGLEDFRRFDHTPQIAYITGIDTFKGLVTFQRAASVREQKQAALPFGSFSSNRSKSSWSRRMPQVGDRAIVCLSLQGRWEILSFTHWTAADEDNSHFDQYENLSNFASRGEEGLRPFAELQPGEFDDRSSGGAYIHGSRFGVLTLEGGQTSMRLDRQQDEIAGSADVIKFSSSGGSSFRLGAVKRSLPPPADSLFNETEITALNSAPSTGSIPAVPGLPNTIREINWRVGVDSIAGKLDYASFIAGDVRDGLGQPLVSPRTLLPLRHLYYTRLADGLTPTTSTYIDCLGNISWIQNPITAVGLPSGVASCDLFPTSLRVQSVNNITLTPIAGVVSLGSDLPVQAAVLGTLWDAQRRTFHTNMQGQLKALAGAITALGAAWGKIGALAVPPSPLAALADAAGAAIQATAAASTAVTTMSELVTTFEANNYLAVKTFVA